LPLTPRPLVLTVYALLWFYFQRATFDWHAVATLSTWYMTLLIQRAEHRDTQAIHGKLDELLRATRGADSGLSELDREEPEAIEDFREAAQVGKRVSRRR
jgi:low affinity Fe/Cu permease